MHALVSLRQWTVDAVTAVPPRTRAIARGAARLIVAVIVLGSFGAPTAAAGEVKTVYLGTALGNKATVSGATGTLVFRLYILQPPNPGATQECTTANLVFTSTKPVTRAGPYYSDRYQTVNTGRHQWVATFYADGGAITGGSCPDPDQQTMVVAPPSVVGTPQRDESRQVSGSAAPPTAPPVQAPTPDRPANSPDDH